MLETPFYGETDTDGLSRVFEGLHCQGILSQDGFSRNRGWGVFEDFTGGLKTGMFTATQATAGTWAMTAGDGGLCRADSGSTTAGQGINVQMNSFCFNTGTDRRLAFETKLKGATISTGPEFFVGLAASDTTLIASTALSSSCIGFVSLTDDNILLAVCRDASAQTTLAGMTTLVDSTNVRLGFRVEARDRVRFFVNGVEMGSITANIPTVNLAPTIVCQTSGTVQPVIDVDWIAALAQVNSR